MNNTYAAKESRKAATKFLRAAAGCALAVIVLLTRGLAALFNGDVFAAFAALAVVVCAVIARTHLNMWQRRAIGAASERRVAKTLSNSNLGHVFNSVVLGAGGDADHVVVGAILATIETKTGRGRVYADKTGMTVGTRKVVGNPVQQANRQAHALRKIAGTWVTAVVCVVDMSNQPFNVEGTIVCAERDLISVLNQVQPTLTAHQRETVVAAIRDLTNGPKL